MDNGTELEFRDGRFVVPDYLADLMSEFDTTMYTRQQAVDKVNSGMLTQRLDRAQQDTIKQHFEKVRTDGSR
jgi:hypothetical protein